VRQVDDHKSSGAGPAGSPAPAGGSSLPSLFSVRNLSFGYGGAFRLAIEELTIGAGERVAVVGHNGSGKTTLLRILAGLEQTGAACLRALPAKRAGFLKQDPYLFDESVARNLAYPLSVRRISGRAARERVAAMLAGVGLADAADRSASQLSGGERKRLALGRVLIADPDVLLLDEPDAHLDPHSLAVIERVLQETRATLVLTTHDLPFAHRTASRVLHLRDGRIAPGLPLNVLEGVGQGARLRSGGGLEIHASAPIPPGLVRVALDPRSLVLSRLPLDSSMRNAFPGRVTGAHDENGSVWLEIACAGERLTAIVSRESYVKLALNLNEPVFVSFKAHAVEILQPGGREEEASR